MDENGIISAFTGDSSLTSAVSSPQAVTTITVPTSQSDFNTITSDDVKGVLQSGSAAVTSIANAVSAVNSAKASSAVNAAVAAQAQQLGLQQTQTQGRIATLQNQTALAQAQAAYNKAAGIVGGSPNVLIIVLGIAGLVIAAAQLVKKK